MSRPIRTSAPPSHAAHNRRAWHPRRLLSATAAAALCGLVVSLLTVPSGTAVAAGSTLKEAANARDGRYFGGVMSSNLMNNSTAKSVAAREFNMITPENEMKWDTIEPSQGNFQYGRADEIVNWARDPARNMRVRGHTLVWWNPDAKQLPEWVKNLPPNQLRAAMENHITNVVSHYRGQVYAWDVVNEPFEDDGRFRSNWFTNAMGTDYIELALRAARAADPNVKLYLNDYNIESNNTAKSNAMYNLARSLKERGVPLDGIGFESHFEVGRPPSDFQGNLARFAAIGPNGLDVAITEWDDRMRVTDTNSQTPVDSNDLNRQASEAADAVRACLNVPRCVGFSQWAVGDRDSWVPLFTSFGTYGAATMFDLNYNPKPAYHSVLNALGGSSTSPPTTPPPTTPPPSSGGSTSLGAWVWLIGAQSNKCLDKPGGDGAQLILYACHGGANQAYLLHPDGSIRVQDKCLDAPTGATEGSKLQVWGCSGQLNQKWTLNTNGQLKSHSTGLCADAWGQGTTDWTPITLYGCHSGANQKWGFSTRAIIGNHSGKCLDAPQGGGNGTQMQLYDCHAGNPNQALTLTANGQLSVRGKCLDVPTNSQAGVKLQIWDCHDGQNQKWVLEASGAIINPISGWCIDVKDWRSDNTAPIVVYHCHSGANQQWHM